MGSRIYIQCHKLVAGINAASQEDAGLTAVQIGRTEEMLCRTVAIAVAPSFLEICFTVFQSLQWVFHHLIGLSRLAVHVYQKLIALVDEPLAAAGGCQIILRCIAYHLRCSVGHVDDSTVRGTHHCLGLAVLVPVVGHDVLLVILEIGHVRTQVYPPETLAVQFEYFYDEILSVIASLLITGSCPARIVELHQNLQFTIAVNVGHTGIVGHVGGGEVAVVGSDFQIFLCPHRSFLAGGCFFLAAHHGFHCVFAGCCSCSVGIVRHVEWFAVHLGAVAIEVVLHVIVFLAHDAPGTVDAVRSFHCHQSAVQLVCAALCKSRHC